MKRSIPVVATLLALTLTSPLEAQSLKGGGGSLDRQNMQARRHDFTYLQSPSQVQRFVNLGLLVPLRPNADYQVHNVSYPYVRPAVRLFVERLASQYRAACGEQLVVTSAIRPESFQQRLRNGSDRSVHPTGMAIDLRRPNNGRCRGWLERVLLDLEGAGVLEATRENYPPHYHVVVFPDPYERYVARRGDSPREARVLAYQVRSGDTLWDLARRHGTTVTEIKKENNLSSVRIIPGQVLRIPQGS